MTENEDQNSVVLSRLKEILSNVDGWLKFAESKNGAIVTLNSLIVLGIVAWFSQNYFDFRLILILYSIQLVMFLIVATLISLVSFLAIIENMDFHITEEPQDGKNLLFFGHLSSFSPKSLLNKLYEQHGKNKNDFTPQELDYAEQIITNSKITLSKYKSFNIALWVTLWGIITPLLGIPIFIVFQKKHPHRKIAYNDANGNSAT